MTTAQPVLWHYTCHHGHAALGERGTLLPARAHTPGAVTRLELLLPELAAEAQSLLDLIWMTDLQQADPLALGLTARTWARGCDRTAYRYRVLDPGLATAYRQCWRDVLPRRVHTELTTDGWSKPGHWWVATEPVPVELAMP